MRNAGALYVQAEADRRAGRDTLAQGAYVDVARKTGDAVRGRPGADWADEALLLYARAQLRLGDYGAAQGALEDALRRDPDPVRRAEIDVYRAVVDEVTGDRARAMELVNTALQTMIPLADGRVGRAVTPALTGEALVDAHLLRGRLLLRQGRVEPGWWDLDRAVELEPGTRAEAGVERLRWGVESESRERTGLAINGLLANPRANVRVDTVSVLVSQARTLWGPATAADLLAAVDSSDWDRAARGRLSLQRARYLDEAGDAVAAAEIATDVSRGLGRSAAAARLLVAEWRAARARDLEEVYGLRALLLPAAAEPLVAERLSAIDELEILVGFGLDEPLGWFAAAEVARDRLAAPVLARGLFLAYGDQASSEPWAPKALLAALEATSDEGDRAWIRGRLEAYPDSPYVLAAHGGPAAGFAELEEELDVRLRELIRE
jgi:tetratricopeptide (TPR) repeat protein